jgi:uncharacterized protein
MKHKIMKLDKKIFPSGIATGEAFCNREVERQQLADNIKNIEHSVLLAPRRYGKTSLAAKVIEETNIAHAWIELFSITSFESTERKIATAVGKLTQQLAPDLKKLQLKIKDFFANMKPEIVLSGLGQKVILHPLDNPTESITELLVQLDKYARDLNKKAVIVFDEFQQLAEIENGQAIEACIRQAVERSENITYLFSGSNRRMLTQMFGDSSRPLYRLCKLITLDRISKEKYEKFVQKAALNKWQKKLAEAAFNRIMELTEQHSFYVNVLCEQLWKQEKMPDFNEIEKVWRQYTFTHKTIIINDILNLSLNQKKCLIALAKSPTTSPLGQAFQQQTTLSLSSLKQALDALHKKDLIFKDNTETIKILDPAVAYLLREA